MIKDYDRHLYETLRLSSTPLVLFGAGSLGKLSLHALKALGIRVDYFCDSDKEKQESFYCGVEVISPEELSTLSPDTHIFICSNYITSVSPLLEQMNFVNVYGSATLLENTDFSETDLDGAQEADHRFNHKPLDISRLIGLHKSALKTTDIDPTILDVKYVDVVVTERCSMKCQDCSNLMQYYVNPTHSDSVLLLKSLDKIMSCIDQLYEFRVLGGEPFVNKEIHKIVDRLVSYKNAKSIVIYTNATILPKRENFECLKNKKVKLDITNYGELSKNHDRLIEALKENEIAYITHRATTWTDSGRIKYRERTEDELIHTFMNCCVGDVLTLLNGKLYRCPFSANAHNLNAIPFNSADVIELNEVNKSLSSLKAEIKYLYTRKERKQYLTACTYCAGRSYLTPDIKAAIQTKKPLLLDESFSSSIFTNEVV